ncbi:MAG: acetyl-CoA carboxylase, carboxyltransferase subunit beta [Endomicrobium sp.]|jgi:acetyl-CoA carboxylase carboxyl transferase subunit beta|nr:acetyl-CoA carboxylase, carboxyltransferase subunit beta [Endomicrobium sp.]
MHKKYKTEESIWLNCKKCDQILLKKVFYKNLMICPKCGYYIRINSLERLEFTVDKDSFKEMDSDLKSVNFLSFPGYSEKLKKFTNKEAIITGEAQISGYDVVIGIMDFMFMGGSMGSVVGEKITRAIECAIKKRKHLILFSASGGARMQEGIMSLMQMGKISAALSKLSNNHLAYISVLTDPTTGGVAASYAMLGDIIIAEPNALICFAGPRVISQTIKQTLPKGFQTAEFLKEHGMIDIISERKEIRTVIAKLLNFFYNE